MNSSLFRPVDSGNSSGPPAVQKRGWGKLTADSRQGRNEPACQRPALRGKWASITGKLYEDSVIQRENLGALSVHYRLQMRAFWRK